MYPALKSYFLSNTESNPRFKHLKQQFADPVLSHFVIKLSHFVIKKVSHFVITDNRTL